LVSEILTELGVTVRQRIYAPFTTLCVFLSQVLSEDHSCREAVAGLMAFRIANGQRPCSPDTNSYCRARKRLPEQLFQLLVQKVGKWLQQSLPEQWLFHGRRVKSVDGSTVSMPDTPANQKAYPQPKSQKPGVGFPIARMVVIFCVASGAALEMAIGPYKGKKTGENSLFRTLWDSLEADDILLADRYYCAYADIALLKKRGVDIVFRKHQRRHSDFRRGKRLGRYDHLITWEKPKKRPSWMDKETIDELPQELALREIKYTIVENGKRTKEVILVTTLLDAEVFTKEELAELYNIRWRAEIDLRSLKTVMEMDVLRCKKPEMVRKEVWTHLLALLASVKTTDAQIMAVGAVELDFLWFAAGLKRVESHFHAVTTELGIDCEVSVLNGHIGEVAMHGAQLATLKHPHDALQPNLAFEARPGFVTLARCLARLAVDGGVILDLQPSLQHAVNIPQRQRSCRANFGL
jgi:hypothetical protein